MAVKKGGVCPSCGGVFVEVRKHFKNVCVPKYGNPEGLHWDDHPCFPVISANADGL